MIPDAKMIRRAVRWGWILGWAGLTGVGLGEEQVVADLTSAYHHIQVVDEGGYRTLSFDGSLESRMLLEDPLQGHFAYTEYFHMAWLWNPRIERVLMIGLGGGTTQRSFEHYYPEVRIDTVELDAMVVTVARQYFQYQESDRQKIHVQDGRVYLRRSRQSYDLIIMDAYTRHRYGSYLPRHLVTQEFFELARSRLTDNGVLCYNVMGSWQGGGSSLVAAVYKTLQTVFPQVSLFTVDESRNIVLVASQAKERLGFNDLHQRASRLVLQKRVALPGFQKRVYGYRGQPPQGLDKAPLLTDDYAPIEGLLQMEQTPSLPVDPQP